MHIAVDLIGEGLPPGTFLDDLAVALDADPRMTMTVVAPTASVESVIAARGLSVGGRVRLVEAARGIGPGPDALHEVRARRDSGARVAARLVRDGRADAMVSVAPLEVVVAAARFTFGLVPGATRAAAVAVLGSADAPVILCDAGGSMDVTADELAQFALAGAALATARYGIEQPRVGLLSARPALLDPLRRSTAELLASLGLTFVGPVTADRLRTAAVADVVVTDGFTGDVVLSALAAHLGQAGAGPSSRRRSAENSLTQGGMIVLGVDGVAVRAGETSHGPGQPGSLPGAVAAASDAVRAGLAGSVQIAMATLVERRRELAGLTR